MTEWFREHPVITYLIILVLITYVYNKVFKTRRLPILKEAIIYLMLAIGAGMLLLFQLGALPIVLCLAVAVGLMFLVRIRYFIEGRTKKQ
ncbi:YlaH-like family protein [Paenibacillus sp. UNC451MF]|uniref:YlaH-like family protein n=1 Tax=Paenibacillus sp. UNC451MF TaxID=1449063 RepID=UPI00048F71F6|nr:YlaH-like family protein [Paenibacillus sp. UNC451MF]